MLETKDKKLQYSRDYYERKKDEIIEQKKEYRQAVRNEVLIRLGGRCSKCGHTDLRALTVIGEIRGKDEGYTTYWNRLYQMSLNPNHLVLLCANCKEIS